VASEPLILPLQALRSQNFKELGLASGGKWLLL